MINMIHKFIKYNYLIHGIEIGNNDSTFENCYITDKKMTEQEVLEDILMDHIQKGYIVTSAKLDYIEEIEINLLTNEIIIGERKFD